MSGFTYRNKTDHRLTIPGVGAVEPGGTITAKREINNQNLERVQRQQEDEAPKKENTTKTAGAAGKQSKAASSKE